MHVEIYKVDNGFFINVDSEEIGASTPEEVVIFIAGILGAEISTVRDILENNKEVREIYTELLADKETFKELRKKR